MQADQLLDQILHRIEVMEDLCELNTIRGLIEEYGDIRYEAGADAQYWIVAAREMR